MQRERRLSTSSDDEFQVYDQSQSQVPNLESETDVESEADPEPAPKRKRGKDHSYVQTQVFESLAAFSQWWATEKPSWSKKTTHSTEDADVTTWYCKYGRAAGFQCPVRLRVCFPHDNHTVLLLQSDVLHDHEPVENASALTPAVKAFVTEQVGNGLAPQRIRVLLSERGFNPLPSLKQVQNLVHRARSSESTGPFTDQQLRAYCVAKVENADPCERFVLDWGYADKDKFHIVWTTRRLLDLQKSQALLQCDATNCVNWLGFPLGVFGFSDVDHHFTPTALTVGPSEDTYYYKKVFEALQRADYAPHYILGDGLPGLTNAASDVFPDAARLVCYPHLDRRVAKHIMRVPEPYREDIRADIQALRYARSQQEFGELANLMLDSWPEEAADFGDYFRRTWIESAENGWHEAASPFVSNNNGLESVNKGIKEAHTLRKKLPFGRFLEAAESILRLWAKDAKLPPAKPTAKPSLYKDAYLLSAGPVKRLVARQPNQDIYIRQAYLDYTARVSTWENFNRARFRIHVVQRVVTDAAVLYCCSCPVGAKKSLCHHALHVMCSPEVGMYTYPPEATANALEQRRKRGRPRLAPVQNRYAVN